jgi:DNA-binding IclR family transcriptional regulator
MTGTIARAMGLVRALASTGSRGLSLTEITESSGLPHPTVHRLLKALVREGLVRQDEVTRRYALGRFAYELGVAAETQFDIREWCQPVVARLSQDLDATVYLSVRSGNEAVCVDRHDGPPASRIVRIEIGNRRPLGVGAGGLAILAALPAKECDVVLASIGKRLGRYRGVTSEEVRKSVDITRRDGYALIRNRLVMGETLTGVCFRDFRSRPIGAVSISTLTQRLGSLKVPALAARIAEAARDIESRLHGIAASPFDR